MKSNIYTKQSGRFALPQFQMLGIVLLIVGVIYSIQLNPWGIAFLFIGIVLATMTTGIQLNLKKRTHRNYFRIIGFKYGNWVEIPTLDYVSVFVEHYSQDMGVASISATDKYKDFKISLIVSKTQRFDAGGFNDKTETFKVAEDIARKLNTKLLDYTSTEPKWINV